MKKAYRTILVSLVLAFPVLALAGLLTLAHHFTASDTEFNTAFDTALNTASLPSVQSLRPQQQGTVILPVDPADVVITKTATVTTARVGSMVAYDVVVENNAEYTVTAVVVDEIPAELQLRKIFTGTATLPPASTDTYTAMVEIAPMDAITLMYSALVRSLPITGNIVTNTAVANVSWAVTAPITASMGITEGAFVISDSASIQVMPSFIPLAIIRSASLDLVANGGFESGSDSSWLQVGSRGTLIVGETQLPEGVAPHGGSFVAWLGGFATDSALLLQNINVPQGYSEVYLQYYYWIDSTDPSCGDDVYAAGAYLSDGTGAATNASDFLCTPTNTNGWVGRCIDIAPFGGQAVDIAFSVLASDDGESSLFIDDVTIEERCTAVAIE